MPHNTQHEPSIDTGAPVPVSVEFVEAQLTELWRDVADAAQTTGGLHAVTMAQVLNLVVRASTMSDTTQLAGDIDYITGRHPCRVLYAIAESAQGEVPVQAWVSIRCQLPPAGGRQVCAEQVSVIAGGEATRQMSAAIIPLLLPDLPVFLWWPHGSPFDDYLFRNLADSLNRLIVDSSTFENPEGTLAKMSSRLKTGWPNMACSDMNWGRLYRWRELIAQFFDASLMRPYLERLTDITIEYSPGQRGDVTRAQALLLAGWLSGRLGWQPAEPVYELLRADGQSPASVRLSVRAGKRPIKFHLKASQSPSDVPGDICLVKLQVRPEANAEPEADFCVALVDDPDKCALTSVEIEGLNPTRRHIQLDSSSRAELLDIELELHSRDSIFEEALELVGSFIRATPYAPKPPEGPRKLPTGEPISAGAHRTRPPGTPAAGTESTQPANQNPGPSTNGQTPPGGEPNRQP